MMRPLFIFLFSIQVFLVSAQVAPEIPQPDSATFTASRTPARNPENKFRKFLQDQILSDSSSELQLLGRSALIISSVSAVGVTTYAFADEPLRELVMYHRTHFTNHLSRYVEPFGRSGNMLPVSGIVYASGLALRNSKLQRAGILAASSLLINDFVTGKLKDEFQRRRPNEALHNYYFEGGEGGRKHQSFPSGHTSTAFTFAASFATVYKNSKWIPPVSYGMATLVGLSRIHDNQHWATDVLAGAAVGFLTTKATNLMLKFTEKHLDKRKVNIYLAPRISSGTVGLGIGGTL